MLGNVYFDFVSLKVCQYAHDILKITKIILFIMSAILTENKQDESMLSKKMF